MIIVEGPDGSGKTTLCTDLQNHGLVHKVLPSPRIAAKGNVERMIYETDRYMRLYGTTHGVAVDRYLFSEMAYGPVVRGKSVFSRNEYLNKLLEINLNGTISIFCIPDTLKFKADENPVVIEKAELLVKAYRALLEDSAFSNPRTILYKWNENGAFNQLKKFIKENRA